MVGKVSAERKLSAAAVGTEYFVPSDFVNDGNNQRIDRGSVSVKRILVSGLSRGGSSSHRPRKRVTFADDTSVSECAS